MSLIDQKGKISFFFFRKEPSQIDIGVESIIVIADNTVRKKSRIEAHFKWADIVFFGIRKNGIPIHVIFMDQHIINAVIDAVVMTFGIRTGGGITLRAAFQKAHFFLCRDREKFKMQRLL